MQLEHCILEHTQIELNDATTILGLLYNAGWRLDRKEEGGISFEDIIPFRM